MFVGALDEVAFDAEMSEDGEGGLGVSEGVSTNGDPWVVVELFLEEVQSKFEVLDDVVEVGAAFVMLYVTSSQYLPVLGLEQLFDLLFVAWRLFEVPLLEETHFTVHERAVCSLGLVALSFAQVFALPQHGFGGVEDLLYRVEAVGHEVGVDVALVGLGVVVAVEVEDPECVEVRVDRHV